MINVVKVFILGSRCNMNCRFCMSTEGDLEPKIVFDEISKMKKGMVVFAGGEPFLYEELEDYLRFAKKRGLKTKVQTNGTIIDFLDLIDVINLPLDGTEDVHDAMRGRGHFRTVMKLLKGLNKEFTLTTVLTKVNIDSVTNLASLINELSEEITIVNWKIFKFKPKGRGRLYRHLFEISDEEFLKAIEAVKRIARVKVYPIRDPDRMRVEVVKKD